MVVPLYDVMYNKDGITMYYAEALCWHDAIHAAEYLYVVKGITPELDRSKYKTIVRSVQNGHIMDDSDFSDPEHYIGDLNNSIVDAVELFRKDRDKWCWVLPGTIDNVINLARKYGFTRYRPYQYNIYDLEERLKEVEWSDVYDSGSVQTSLLHVVNDYYDADDETHSASWDELEEI